MNKRIFYHMYCIGDCVERFLNTYSKIKKAGLLKACNDIHVCLVGNNLTEYCSKIESLEKVKIIEFNNNVGGEMNTIKALHQHCKTIKEPEQLLYLHSKGVSKGKNMNIKAWVDYMEYFLVEKYETCLEALCNHDTVGVDFYQAPLKHYSGNFWWANSEYLKTLLDFEESLKKGPITDSRWFCEFWLLNTPDCKPCSLHTSGLDLYGTIYNENNYRN